MVPQVNARQRANTAPRVHNLCRTELGLKKPSELHRVERTMHIAARCHARLQPNWILNGSGCDAALAHELILRTK